MAPNDLQDLFNRLKASNPSETSAQSPPSIWTQPQPQTHQQPSVSSPIFTPPVHTPNPVHSSNVLSPVHPASAAGTPGPDQARTNNLLNLLKFNNQGSQSNPMANLQNVGGVRSSTLSLATNDSSGGAAYPRPVSAQDLMASFQRKSSSQNVLPSASTAAGAEKPEQVAQTGNSKDFLLNLLTKPKEVKPTLLPDDYNDDDDAQLGESGEKETPLDKLAAGFAEVKIEPITQAQPVRESTPVRHFGTAESDKTAFEAPQPTKAHIFNYVNPFDQLHTSSPLNRASSSAGHAEPKKIEILKHNRDISSTANGESSTAPVAKSRKLTPAPASPAPADAEKGKSVSEALKGVGDAVDKQVEEALAQADIPMVDAAPTTAASVPIDGGAADDLTNVKREAGNDDAEVDSNWESAEEEEAEKAKDPVVEVFNFPMKPFVSIQIKSVDALRPLRQENFMHVAKLKKEFDQIDRSLVTASQTHIMYAQLATKEDNGGFRIIRQDTGQNKHVFRSNDERIFNVQICSSTQPGDDLETVLATGVNGSIFWTSLSKSGAELFADDDVEAQGFAMPAVSTPEEQASGSQVKTRAKMSSRHPEYFAVARGNQIHIIAPETVKSKAYRNAKSRKINSEKYLAEHGLKISMGKACKDFCFSEDDTMIATLDKSGRFRFWDIKDLTARAADTTEGKHEPVELRDPIWSLQAAASGSKPEEKPSVSSIMFLDKDRPMSRGIALRYMLIGFKQNHILQLWDLGLGKAVQEIRLPHEKDSDGICSVTYHSRSGIIAIGHPTRNSIYFIHLSAPRYNIGHMDQAKYITLLALADPSVPRPESTAIMSGLREFSFAKVGQLRSLDMLAQPVENPNQTDSNEETLFELYVMHSRGVVGIPVKRNDLGWDKDSKMIKPVDAVQAGVVEVKDLIPPPKPTAPSEQSSNADTPTKQTSKSAGSKKPETPKSSAPTAGKAEVIKKEAVQSANPRANGPAQGSKQVPEAPMPSDVESRNPPLMTPDSYAMAAQRATLPTEEETVVEVPAITEKALPSTGETASVLSALSPEEWQAMLNKEFGSLYQRIDADKRVQDAASTAKQDAVLRLVSSTLTENVEKSLNRIVSENMTKEIVPSITSSINKVVEKKLNEMLPQQLNSHMSKEMKAALPNAIQQSLKDPQVHNTISNQVAQKVQQQVSQLLQQSMPNLATQATQKMVSDLENRTKQQLQQADARRQQDNAKIQELSGLVQGLSQMVQQMSESQAAFQEQILKMQRPSSRAGPSQQQSTRDADSTLSAPMPEKTPEEEEADNITQLLMAGQYDSATVAWLQSPHQGALFDQVFLRVNPRYLEKVAPLIALSVSAAITATLTTHVHQRLEWLGAALDTINLQDTDIKEVAPKIMDVLSQRLQGAYMDISEANPSDTNLRKISAMNRKVMEIRKKAEEEG